MSWSGFKKAVNRAGQQVILRATKHEESVDADFNAKEKSFKAFQGMSSELQEDMAGFVRNFEKLLDVQLNIVKTVDSFYGDYDFDDASSPPRDGISLEYLRILKEIRDMVLPELQQPLKVTVLDPISDIKSYNDEIQKLIGKRGRKKFDYDVLRTKLHKLEKERTATDPKESEKLVKQMEKLDKVKQEFAEAEAVYSDLNERLKNEVDQYLALRFSLLDPTFESFIKIQMKLYGEMYTRLSSSNLSIDAMTIEQYKSGEIDDRLDNILAKMKGLDLMNL